MRLSSTAFADGGRIPSRYTCDGENLSPPLLWTGVPKNAKSLVLTCDDPDAPLGKWHHWAVYDLAPGTSSLPEGVSPDDRNLAQATNDFRRQGYGGPCPPTGHGPHRYDFRLLALTVAELGLSRDPSCKDVEAAARRHIVAEARLCGLYGR
jgi:Raf kinase inhibitor-like YbhB/YbcL family protein